MPTRGSGGGGGSTGMCITGSHGQGTGHGASPSPAAQPAKRKIDTIAHEKKKRRHDASSSLPNRSMASFFSPKGGVAASQKKSAFLPGVSPPVSTATTEVISDQAGQNEVALRHEKRKAGEPAAQTIAKRPAFEKEQPAAEPVSVPSIASFFGK